MNNPYNPPRADDPAILDASRRKTSIWQRVKKRLAPVGVAIVAFLAKIKTILLFLFKIKFVATALTALVSMVAYGMMYGWAFGVGFVLILGVHEFGHWFVLRREGVKAGLPIFIPFLGAVIAMKQSPLDAWQEFKVAAGGPLFGVLASVVPLLVAYHLGIRTHAAGLWLSIAYVGFFLQLFNLIPLVPMDGGRIVAAVSPVLWWVGLAILIAYSVIFQSAFIIVVLVLFGFEALARWRNRRKDALNGYYDLRPSQRIVAFVTWVALIGASGLGMMLSQVAQTH